MSATEFISKTWDMLKEGTVIEDAVNTLDNEIFNGIPVANTLGAGETISAVVGAADSAANGDVQGIIENGAELALSRVKVIRAAVNGNSKKSTKPQHLYSIIDLTDGSVYKYGISGGVLNKNGTSGRANLQANALNKIAGFRRYKPVVLMKGIKGRAKALAIEYAFVYGYQEATGAKPIGNLRP